MNSNEHTFDPIADRNSHEQISETVISTINIQITRTTSVDSDDPKSRRRAAKQRAHLENVRELFVKNYSRIWDCLAAYEWVLPITILNLDDTMRGLAAVIHCYDDRPEDGEGPADPDERFVNWCANRATDSLKITALHNRYRRAVLAGIWSIARNCQDLIGKTKEEGNAKGTNASRFAVAEIEADTWTRFLENETVDQITDAKRLVSFFYNVGKNGAKAWKQDEIRFRQRLSLDDADRFANVGARDGEFPKDQSIHPYHAGPNDNLDGLTPEEPKPKKPRNSKQPAKPRRKYTQRPKTVFSSYSGVVVVPKREPPTELPLAAN